METNYSFVHIQMSAEVQVFQDATIVLKDSDKKEITIRAAVIPRNFNNLVTEGASFHIEKDEYIFETTFDSIVKTFK